MRLKLRKEKLPASTQDHLDILDIQDDLVILKNGSYRIVAKVSPLNFSLKSENEQEVIIETYRVLLNSLSFPVQVVISSRKIDIQSYLDSLGKSFARDGLAKKLGQSHLRFIRRLVEANNILERHFYLVIPYSNPNADLKEAKSELFLRLDGLAGYLKRVGIELKQLGAEELINLYSSHYSSRKRGEKAIDRIAPEATYLSANFFKVGDIYTRTFFVSGYPDEVSGGWLSPLLNLQDNLDISLHIYPISSFQIISRLQRDVRKSKRTIAYNQMQGRQTDEFMLASYEDATSLMKKLARGKERVLNLSLYVTLRTQSLEELEAVSKKLSTTFSGLMLTAYPATFEMEKAFKSSLPLGKDHLFSIHNFDTSSLSTAFPFISAELSSKDGVLYGVNRGSHSLVIFDRFSSENANSVVCAKSGAGKSYAMKLDALRNWLQGVDVIVIDPERDFERLCQAVGGQLIRLSAKSEDKINPCDLSRAGEEGELTSKALYLQALAELMFGKMGNREKNLFDQAVFEAYKRCGITADPEIHQKRPPLLKDIQNVLLKNEETKEMAMGLERFTSGSFSSLFNGHTNVDLNKSFVVIDTRDLEEQLRRVGMFMALGWVWDTIRSSLKKRILICDEVWELLQDEDSGRFLFSLAKRARKYWLGFTAITQDVEDFLNSDYGKVLVTNSSMQLLLKQSEASIETIVETFKLSEGERAFLLSCDVGEGLLFAAGNHAALSIKASEEEHKLITTRPEEVLKLQGEC